MNKKQVQHFGWSERRSASGTPLYLSERPMPKMPDEWLNLAFYLYGNEHDAENNHHTGGSGFFAGVPSPDGHVRNLYAITNAHVVKDGFGVFRINNRSGGYEVHATSQENWHFHDGGDDIAVCPVQLPPEHYKFRLISTDQFVTEEMVKKFGIGIGDEVVMVGRFTGHQGQSQNIPITRFGTIAMTPTEPTMNGLGKDRLHYLVEVRSVSGFSGSPVLVYDLPFSLVSERQPSAFQQLLLGVDCGHLPEKEKYISAGIAAVVPAWRVLELLNQKELVEMRKEWDQRCTELEKSKSTIVPD